MRHTKSGKRQKVLLNVTCCLEYKIVWFSFSPSQVTLRCKGKKPQIWTMLTSFVWFSCSMGYANTNRQKNYNNKLCNHIHIFFFHSDPWSQNLKEEGNFLPVQFSPSPRNPGLQEQVCELSAFLHVALVWQSDEDATHSSASDKKRNFEGHWLVLVLVVCVSGCVRFLLVPTFCH